MRWRREHDVVAVLGLVAFIAILLTSVGVLFVDAVIHRSNEPSQATEASRKHCEAALLSMGYALTTESGPTKDNKKNSPDHTDVCQQFRIAEAAKRSAEYARWQFVLGALNLLFLVLATGAAVAAAAFARDAAKHTRRQAEIAETSYRNLERPYILETIKKISIAQDGGGFVTEPYVRIALNNLGRTPAVLVQIAAHLVISNGRPDEKVLNPTHLAHKGRHVLPDRDDTGRPVKVMLEGGKITPEDQRDLRDYRQRLWLAGEIFYSDMQGRVYDTPFEWEYNAISNSFVRHRKPKNQSRNHEIFKHHMPRSVLRDDRVPDDPDT